MLGCSARNKMWQPCHKQKVVGFKPNSGADISSESWIYAKAEVQPLSINAYAPAYLVSIVRLPDIVCMYFLYTFTEKPV